MINLLSDPDFVNRTIAWFASDSAYTSEYFCQALRMSESIEEIDVVIRQLNSFMDKLRGHDTGGDDDALIKAQLGSLDYVRKICLIRRRQIQEGVAEKPGRALAYHLQPDARIYDMSFQELMTKSVAVVCFLDFLASINKHSLLRLYLNCVSFREGVSKLIPNATINQNIDPSVLALAEASRMEAISSDMSTTIITDDLCLNPTNPIEITNTDKETLSVSYSLNFEGTQTEVASNLCDNEIDLMGKEDSITTSLDEGEQQNTMVINEEIKKNILEKSGDDIVDDSIEQLRAFGITICSNLLHFMPLSAEPLIQRTLKTLTGEPNSLNPNSFTEIEAHVSNKNINTNNLNILVIVNILSSPDCFGAFKRSSQYIHLLAELDLLKEPLEQSSSSNFISIPPISNDTLPQSQSQSLSQSDKITVSSGSIIHNISSLSQMPCSANSVEDCTDWKCIENDSSKETKQSGLPRLSESRIISTTNTTGRGAFDDVYTAAITRAEIMHDSYVIYTIKVTRTVLSTSQSESWNTLRRFRHFVELHSFLTNRCGRITELKLPSKIAFNNMSPEFLAQRRRGLNVYLNTLCSSEFQNNHPGSRPLCIEFLQPDSWERGHVEARIVSAILTPFRTVSNAMMSVPDTLADGLNKIFANKNFPTSNSPILSRNDEMMKKSSEFELQESLDMSLESSKSSDSYDYNVRDETPIQILFLLVDEIFDLHRESQFTRQGNFAILRKIFQTFFGIRVNKMIIAKACEWTSAPKITQLITYLRDYFWPPKNKSSNTTALTERDKEMKLRTRVLCRTVLLGSVSEEFAQFLGNETTRRGVSCVFNMLQEERFNRRFVHTVLEAFLCRLFRPYHTYWEAIYEKNLCPLKCGRACRSHK
uniref:Sorting nexin, putative n=1 Tax=Schistosoma mansoni TaxID=6183 RepID=A0A3Q0KPK6_SCHMA